MSGVRGHLLNKSFRRGNEVGAITTDIDGVKNHARSVYDIGHKTMVYSRMIDIKTYGVQLPFMLDWCSLGCLLNFANCLVSLLLQDCTNHKGNRPHRRFPDRVQ